MSYVLGAGGRSVCKMVRGRQVQGVQCGMSYVLGTGPRSASAGGAERQTRRDLEREITRDMFSIRVAEMKAIWFGNR